MDGFRHLDDGAVCVVSPHGGGRASCLDLSRNPSLVPPYDQVSWGHSGLSPLSGPGGPTSFTVNLLERGFGLAGC
jgi:hypothetical protein